MREGDEELYIYLVLVDQIPADETGQESGADFRREHKLPSYRIQRAATLV